MSEPGTSWTQPAPPTPEEPGRVVTFYSYKGGVGRTFLLANVAWLLARWGYRVLCIDWDLEAPGLHRYLVPDRPDAAGLLDLVVPQGRDEEGPDWRDLVERVASHDDGHLDLLRAGRMDNSYVKEVQDLNWTSLYESGFGTWLEQRRAEWISAYHFVLIDSRTGISDIGGICAAQLPDVLLFLFTANNQSLEGAIQVVRRARDTRAKLSVDRGGLLTVPIPSRFDAREEYLRGRDWLARFEKTLPEFYEVWRDKNQDVGALLAQLRVPYLSYWSFGENLPVRQERLDDAELITFWFANVAALLAHDLGDVGRLVESRHGYVREVAGPKGLGLEKRSANVDVFISHGGPDLAEAETLHDELLRLSLRPYVDVRDAQPGSDLTSVLREARSQSQVFAVLFSARSAGRLWFEAELEHILELASHGDVAVVPIYLDDSGYDVAPLGIRAYSGLRLSREGSWAAIADRLAQLVTSTSKLPPSQERK